MSNWPIVRLETLATFKNGLNFPGTSWGRGTKIIGVSDFGSRMFPDYETLDEVDPRGVVRDVDLWRRTTSCLSDQTATAN